MAEVVLDKSHPLSDAMDGMNQLGRRFCLVTDARRVIGVITDGDIRRYLRAGGAIDDHSEKAMNHSFTSLSPETDPEEVQRALRHLTFIPILDAHGSLVYVATPDRPHRIPLAEPFIGDAEETKLLECFHSGWISSRSPFVAEFEEAFSTYIGVDQGVCVSNGTVAIELALRALGIKAGDEIIVPDLTFGATANAVLNVGASPRFVDVTEDDWGMDPAALAEAISAKTRGVILVHLYGAPARLEEIRAICDTRGILLIEDCAEAIGARISGSHVGAVGDAATFSFFANKTITTGEGGYVTFRGDEALQSARLIRDHGLSRNSNEHYWHSIQGGNMRMTGLQAAIGIAQLERAEDITGVKRGLADQFRSELEGVHDIDIRGDLRNDTNSHWLVVAVLSGELAQKRHELQSHLGMMGIETRLGFQPLHQMPAFAEYFHGSPIPERSISISEQILCLPSGAKVGPGQVRTTAAAIKEFVEAHS